MSCSWSDDQAFQVLEAQREVILGAAGTNESTTRLRAIDTILFDVMRWDKLVVETEKFCRAQGFADYVFLQHNSCCLVLEAKKDGKAFVLPDRSFEARAYVFGLLAEECKEAAVAFEQAVGYSTQLGSRYTVISNGTQWLFALTYVSGQLLTQRNVFVFESYDAIRSRFRLFWNCMSPIGVYGNAVSEMLLESRMAASPAKLSIGIPAYPRPAERNVLVNELDYILGAVWDEVSDDETEEEFLRECYCRPESVEDLTLIAKEVLTTKRSRDVLDSVPQIDDSQNIMAVIPHYSPEKPVILLGSVGHGKTTFLRNLRQVEAKDVLDNYIQVDVDFLDRPDHGGEIAEYFYDEVERQLLERYAIDVRENSIVRGSLHGDLQRFRRTPEALVYDVESTDYKREEVREIRRLQSDRHMFLGKVIKHLKRGRNKSVAVFCDNLDRRDDSLQEEAFLKASAVARDWAALVFVCLRPGTFYHSRMTGVLDSIASRAFTITPPKVHVLLRKRFRWAKRVAEGSVGQPGVGGTGQGVIVQLPKAAKLLDVCERSVKSGSSPVVAFLRDVSNGDLRALLHYTKLVLTSRHLNTRKIVEKEESGNEYVMPLHEALRALLFLDYLDYDPAKSIFINLFDIVHADKREHFARILTLNFVGRFNIRSETRGFVKRDDVLSYLGNLGFGHVFAHDTMRSLCERKCVETRVPGVDWTSAVDEVRLTSLGRFHIAELCRTFQYIDAVVIDTPIIDNQSRGKIRDEHDIIARVARAQVFLEYLRGCMAEINDAPARELWLEIDASIRQDISRAEGSAQLRMTRDRAKGQ